MSTFGKRLKELRTNKKLTQKEFASLFKLGESTISMYERDEREPSFELVRKFADFFEVTTDYILARVDDPDFYVDKHEFLRDVKEKGLDFSGMTEEEIDMFIRFVKDYRKNKGLD